MRLGHLTDNELQLLMDNAPIDDKTEIASHLNRCETCQVELDGYRMIYLGLQGSSVPELSDDFADNVVAALDAETAVVTEISPFWSAASSIVGAVAVLSLLVWYFDWNLFSFLSGAPLMSEKLAVDNPFVAIVDSVASLGINPAIVFGACAILVVMSQMERILSIARTRLHNTSSLMSI